MSNTVSVQKDLSLGPMIPLAMEAGGLGNRSLLKAHTSRPCAGCGARAAYRVVIRDMATGRVVQEIFLCSRCAMLKFVSMRPYLARVRPRLFDEMVCRGLI